MTQFGGSEISSQSFHYIWGYLCVVLDIIFGGPCIWSTGEDLPVFLHIDSGDFRGARALLYHNVAS